MSLSLTEALTADGLRFLDVPGVPSPWTESARGILYVKKLQCEKVVEEQGERPRLLEWTNQDSKPVVAWNDERPATGWAEILHLAERLAPEPAQIPSDHMLRAQMFGLSHELCGEMGLGWSLRLLMFAGSSFPERVIETLGTKYGWSEGMGKLAKPRVLVILSALQDQLFRQQQDGSRFLIGETLSALDIYWATFCALLDPLRPDLCPMNDFIRSIYRSNDDDINHALSSDLIVHRDFIYNEYLELPVPM